METRISDMGPDGDEIYDATMPAVAYNDTDNQYLVVWEGDDNVDGPASGEFEIRAHRIDGVTGQRLGADDFRVSSMGPDGDPSYDAHHPSVAYNKTDNQYLVVWHGDDDTNGLADEEFEIYGQLLDAMGAAIGTAFRISAMGPDGDPTFFARRSRVAYNLFGNEYLVVWDGIDDSGTLVAGESEIFGQFIDASGQEIGLDDFRISDMGPDGNPSYDAFTPSVAYSDLANEYLVVWEGDDDTDGLVAGKFEIFGQFIEGATGLEIGQNDFRISQTEPDPEGRFDAANPSVAYNNVDDEYLVVWDAEGDPLPEGKFEIRGRRIDAAAGTPIGSDDFAIGTMGDPGDIDLDAKAPKVAYNAQENTYLVVWEGDDTSGALVDNEIEIYGRIVTFPMTGSQFRVSDMGTDDGNGVFDARRAIAVYNGVNNEFLVVWDGDDDTGALANGELEVYGQRLLDDGMETGTNDFRISTAGPDGDLTYDARSTAVAYNSIDNEYLVVWEGDDNVGTLVEGEQEIFGQRVDAATGAEIGANDFRISDMGPDGDPNFEAGEPRVAYNSIDHLYLVVWEGDDDTGALVDGEFETWGQLIDAATGEEIGADFRISDVGPDGQDSRDTGPPAVAYDGVANRFLVVWEADDTDAGIPNHKNEIFGQLLDGATGAEIGVNDFRISDMGPNDDPEYDAREVAVAFNPVNHEYLVVWRGEDDAGALVFNEFEIFGQRIDAATGAEVGVNDFRISQAGSTDGDAEIDAEAPDVAHNRTTNEYLVVWSADDDRNGLVNDEQEIFGQLLDGATGAEIGVNDFRISDMGPDGDPSFDATEVSIVYNATANEYMVAWGGNDDSVELHPLETEIFVQWIDASGFQIGENDLRVSQMGQDGDSSGKAADPAVTYGGAGNGYLISWHGDDASGEMIDNENEIYCVASVRDQLCGNGVVDPGEDCANCPTDVPCPAGTECVVGVCEPSCGNGVVDPGEDCANCPTDVQCPPGTECVAGVSVGLCGNGVADPGEDCANCPADIPCPPGEECVAGVCEPLCGNGVIDPGEDCANCPADVQCDPDEECFGGVCSPLCGNGVIDPGENCENCVFDVVCPPGTECVAGVCQPRCGNGVLDPGEDCENCPADVVCPPGTECVGGMCELLCGNGVLDPGEDCENCPADVVCPPGTGCANGMCERLCGNGLVDPGEDCENCPADVVCPPGTECLGGICEPLCGNEVPDPGENCSNCPQDIVCPPATECLSGECVPLCGNGVPGSGENCETCPDDVQCPPGEECVDGMCVPVCGNGFVDPGEDCANCPADVQCPPDEECVAGVCAPLCGNGGADPGEDCQNCPADVQCPPGEECVGGICQLLCGNGIVDPGEDCANCPADVQCPPDTACVNGMCEDLCGNGLVDPGEDCVTCPIDVPCRAGTTCIKGLCECPWDIDGDGIVGITDLLDLLAAWGPNPGHPTDFDGDGTVGITDFLDLLTNWGPCS